MGTVFSLEVISPKACSYSEKASRGVRNLTILRYYGGMYTADKTRAFAASCGLKPRTTPAYSPESKGMAEAFVKTFKRDYVYLADLWNAPTVLRLLPQWFADYNEHHPHKGLNMLSPRQFRRANSL